MGVAFRIDTRPAIQKSRKADEWKRCEAFLQWLRGRRACLLAPTGKCSGPLVVAHFDPHGDKGVSTKVNDRASMLLCDGHHREQTDVLGWPAFQMKYGFDGRAVCRRLYLAWPGRAKDQAKLAALGHRYEP